MTSVQFDEAAGRLRLDQATFDCLVSLARGSEEPGPGLIALRDAGAVQDAAVHPALAPGLEAVTAPVCRLRLTLTDEEGRLKAGDGWLGAGVAALLLDLPDGGRDFFTVPPSFVPAAIARVVRLGPRPRPEPEPLLPEALAGVPGRIWRAQMTWNGPDGPTGRSVQVADTKTGLFLVASDSDESTFWPTTPTAVWRILIRLLPDTTELR